MFLSYFTKNNRELSIVQQRIVSIRKATVKSIALALRKQEAGDVVKWYDNGYNWYFINGMNQKIALCIVVW